MATAVIVDAVRTAGGKRNGRLSGWHPVDLAAETLKALTQRNDLDPALVDDVIMGCVMQVGAQSLNIGRNAVLAAGFPESVPSTTIDRQCGSSQQSAHFAAQGVMAGAYDVVIAAGIEVMSVVPMGASAMVKDVGFPFGDTMGLRYADVGGLVPQGISAELIAEKWGISRDELDAFGALSQQRAEQATAEGRFDNEIIPVRAKPRDKQTGELIETDEMHTVDEGIRPGTTIETLANLKPAFKPDALTELSARWSMHPPVGLDEDAALGLAPAGEVGSLRTPASATAGLPAERATVAITPPSVVAQVATPRADDYRQAGAIHQAIPEVLQRAARHQSDVVPMLLGLLHAPPGQVRDAQQYELRARTGPVVAEQSLDYADRLTDLHPALRLPLASLAFPTLRRRPRPELNQFLDLVFALVHADGKIDLFEYCLGRLLRSQVIEALDPARAWVPGRLRLMDASAPAVTLLTVIAQAGHDNPADAPRAFVAGLDRVFPRLSANYTPPTDMLGALDAVLPVLDGLEPMGKELLIEGLVAAVSHDGRVSVAESELLRTVCAALHVPLPPMLADVAAP